MDATEKTWTGSFLIALIGFFSLFMSITVFFVFPLFFEPLGASKSRIGLIMGVHSLMAIFIRPVFGRLIDIQGRKKISLVGIVLLLLTLPFYHLIQDAGLLPLVLRALTGIGWGISMTATMTICSDLAPVTRLAKSMGIIGVAGLVSVALGPLLAEEIVGRFGFAGLFNTSLLFLVIAFVCIWVTREKVRPNNNHASFFQAMPKKPLTILSLVMVASLPVVHGAVRGAVVYFIVLFGKMVSVGRIGPFFVAFSAAAILTRLLFGGLSDRYGRKKILLPAVGIISVNLFLISQVHTLWLLTLTGFIGGFGQGLIFPALSTYVIDVFGRENKGLAISLYLTFFDMGMGLGSVFFGWVSDLSGYRTMYMTAGVLFLLAGFLFHWKAPKADLA